MVFKQWSPGTKGPEVSRERHWDSPQPRQRFSSFLEPLHTATSASCSQQTRVSPCVVFCFWTSSALRLKVVLLQSWSSVYFAYNECLFELLLPSLGSKQSAHSPMSPHLKKAFSLRFPLTEYFIFSRPFSLNPKHGFVGKSQKISSFWHTETKRYSNRITCSVTLSHLLALWLADYICVLRNR